MTRQQMAKHVLIAGQYHDNRFLQLTVKIAMRTGLNPNQIIVNINRLARGEQI